MKLIDADSFIDRVEREFENNSEYFSAEFVEGSHTILRYIATEPVITIGELFELAIKMSKPIEDSGLSPAVITALRRYFHGGTIGDLYQSVLTEEVYRIRGIGEKSLYEINRMMEYDLRGIMK
jgi:hypothetical protein